MRWRTLLDEPPEARVPDLQRWLAVALLCAALVLCLSLAGTRRPGRPACGLALLVLAGSAAWLSLHEAYEGPTVVDAGFGHGLAVADLGVPPSVGIALAVLVRRRR